jgi:prepilin-type N-terminal cleavage/methylation domain-containing protein
LRIADCGLAPGVLFNPQSAIRHPQSQKGVTLTEVIVASALLVISIAPLLKALTLAQVEDRAIERKSWSLLLAQRELEWIRARSLRSYDACCRVRSKAVGDGYLRTVTDDEDPDLKTVVVSVGLDQDGDGVLSPKEVEVTLSTRLARR